MQRLRKISKQRVFDLGGATKTMAARIAVCGSSGPVHCCRPVANRPGYRVNVADSRQLTGVIRW